MRHPSAVLVFATTLFAGLASCSGCAAAASASAAHFDADPDAAYAWIPANISHDCISSIPVQKDYSKEVLESLRAWIELESKLDYLRRPFKGYLWGPIDVLAELDRITNSLDNYASQYDFEIDLQTLGLHCHDYHTSIRGGISASIPFWSRGFDLVSASRDGIEAPKVYLLSDVVDSEPQLPFALKSDTNISPVQTINELPVQMFLQTQQLVASSHDPDSMYNQLFFSLPQSVNPGRLWYPTFNDSVFYPGPETSLRFENGSHYTRSTWAAVPCMMGNITTGQEYWNACVYPEGNANTTTVVARPTPNSLPSDNTVVTAASVPSVTQIASHAVPIVVDSLGLLAGYFIDKPDYSDVAVLVIRSFDGRKLPDYLKSFQDSLEKFLGQARNSSKTRLVIDIQGNGGGIIDAGTELVAQLFPNVPPDQKGNFRASIGFEIILEELGRRVELANGELSDTEDILTNEARSPYAWQAVMSPNATEFISFRDSYGPRKLDDGSYTEFHQMNYTNTDPGDFSGPRMQISGQRIQVTGYGERTVPLNTPSPFNPENIVLLSDGYCGSTCSLVCEILTNEHLVPAIAVGGRPIPGPMQTVGNTKGGEVFDHGGLKRLYDVYTDDNTNIVDRKKAKGTVFEGWSSFAVDQDILFSVNAKNNYRIGDDSNTPLQMVYGAADCKMWYTFDMLVDPVAVWTRAAEIAFTDKPFTSKYCVEDSTGHGSSVTGGLKRGSLRDQSPPPNTKPQYLGWLRNGSEIVQGFSLVSAGDSLKTGVGEDSTTPVDAPMKQGRSG